MRRLFFILGSLGFLALGGWLLFHMHEIRGPGDVARLVGQQISQLAGGAVPQNVPWRRPAENVIRIGSFNADQFDESKMKDPLIAAMVLDIIRQFDVIALQEVDTRDPFAMKRFVNDLNETGRQFDVVSGTRQHPDGAQHQSAILYDASTIELDRGQFYHINDPDNVIARDPLVAWFRTRAEGNAFTFSLVNVHLDAQSTEQEVLQVSQIFRAVRNDGRMEDDVILAGDFGVSAAVLNEVALSNGLQAINGDASTSTRSTAQLDNFMLDPLATSEFTGETGVLDFMKVYNLTLAQALNISDHLPVWADFEVFENGAPGRVAGRTAGQAR